VWWYKFRFNGQVIRETSRTNSRTVAREAEKARRRELELAVNRIPKRERVPLFRLAAKEWQESKTGIEASSLKRYCQCVDHLVAEFGDRLVCDLDASDIAGYQRKRLATGVTNRTVNYEVGALRGILKKFRLWNERIAADVNLLKETHDVGKAVSLEDEEKLITAARRSRSLAILPLLCVSIDTGMRASEIKGLRRQDLGLDWENGVIQTGEIIVPKSKSEAGTGRYIPLTRRACVILTMWLSRFPDARAENYVFPYHKVGIGGDSRVPQTWAVNLNRPMGEWKKAWEGVCKSAGVRYRWHDLRHTFISRLAENPNVSEETLKQLAGHVSRKMLERYSHIRRQAKQEAIATLEQFSNASQIDPILGRRGTKLGTVNEEQK
jgi:integrase